SFGSTEAAENLPLVAAGGRATLEFKRWTAEEQMTIDPAGGNFDVLVVGSGASGGWAAKRLSEAGLKVALVDAGRPQSDKNFTEHVPAFELKYRNRASEVIRRTRPIQGNVASEYNYEWFCNDLEEPYPTGANMPFTWMGRLRVTGGRTNVW